jgi:hypothetical protein
MAWIEFPFPECPACACCWKTSFHRGCAAGGGDGIEVDPDRSFVRCSACATTWDVWDTSFFCSCGRRFEAAEVEAALHEIIRVAKLLADVLARQAADMLEIRRAGASSFRSWLARFTEGVASTMGVLAGRVVGTLLRGLGWQ